MSKFSLAALAAVFTTLPMPDHRGLPVSPETRARRQAQKAAARKAAADERLARAAARRARRALARIERQQRVQ